MEVSKGTLFDTYPCNYRIAKRGKMSEDKIYKTVRQYNKTPITVENMEKLLEIASDYRKVKNYVYDRFGGVGSLSKLYPGYTVQNEMTACGLRNDLGLPSVYFYLAVFDALKDIKTQWARTKSKVLQLVGANPNFTPEEKHYLRFVLKINNAFTAILNQEPMKLPAEIEKKYKQVAEEVDRERMHRYVCRQVRKYHVKQHTDTADGFSISAKAYRYQDHGICIATKQNRKRIFVPLTDNNRYASQLYVKLYPEKRGLEIMVPVYMTPRCHDDYTNQVGISIGMFTMVTTSGGHYYGEKFGDYQGGYAEWIQVQAKSYSINRQDNPGRKKYNTKKKRLEEQLHAYINQELNRFLENEKPGTIYMVKLPKPQTGGINSKINHQVSMWQRGDIRDRLMQKCREQSIEYIEVLGKDISRQCSNCGNTGEQKETIFVCRNCGYRADKKINTARNTLQRGMEGRVLH